MIDPDRFGRRAEALSELLGERLGVRGRGIETRLARAGRKLPRRGRRAATEIAQASRRMAHPRLARLHDPARLDAAFNRLTAHLRRIDPAERRRQAVLSVLAVILVNLMLVGLGVWAVLRWRGLA